MSDPVAARARETTLLIVRRPGASPHGSEELRYLREMGVAEAEAVFDSVRHVGPEDLRVTISAPERGAASEDPHGVISEADWVLLEGSDPLFIGRASLGAMRDCAVATIPCRLDRLGLGADHVVHTLREYERVERDFLERLRTSDLPPAETVPALLAPAARLIEPGRQQALTQWIDSDTDLCPLADGLGAQTAGLCHCFVDYYGSRRDDVLPLLPEGVVDVLEVGCGKGFTGAMLQERRGCRVTGIEINEEIAEEAGGRLHRVIHGDVMEVELEERFDAVVLFDVLEHVTRAEALLGRVAALLRPGGVILLSLPNVGHYSVVLDLLAGRWDYLPMGLLCYSHVRFFTRRTLEDWLRRCGFERFEIFPRTTPLPADVDALPDLLEVDRDSLATHGFHVVIHALASPRRAGSSRSA